MPSLRWRTPGNPSAHCASQTLFQAPSCMLTGLTVLQAAGSQTCKDIVTGRSAKVS